MRLAASDVTLHGARIVLRLRTTHTGREQPVTIEDWGLAHLLRELLACTKRGSDKLFPVSYAVLRTRFRWGMRMLGLPLERIVFHSLRHGGATALFEAGWSLDNIAHFGRWRSLTTTRRYITSGIAVQVQLRLRDNHRQRSEELLRRWPFVIGPN